MNSLIPYGSSTRLAIDLDFETYFNHLFKTKTCVDVTFILETSGGEIEFVAHQLVLAMRSPYFADEFYGDQRYRKHRTVRLKEINPKAFEDMIKYCYACQPSLETIEDTGALFQVANYFKIMSLVNVCHSRLKDFTIESKNVFTLLEVSEYMEDERIKNMCKTFIEEKTTEVINSYELPEVTATMIHVILSLPKLSFNYEYELITWIFRWAKVKCQENYPDRKNVREYLDNFLQKMNFLDLTFEEFATLCKDYPDCFDSSEITSIYINIYLKTCNIYNMNKSHNRCWKMPDWFKKDLKSREYIGWEMANKHTNDSIENLQKEIADILEVEECCIGELEDFRSKCKDIDKNIKLSERSLSKSIVGCYEKLKKMSKREFTKITKNYTFEMFAKDEKRIEVVQKSFKVDYLAFMLAKELTAGDNDVEILMFLKLKEVLQIDDEMFAKMQILFKNNDELKEKIKTLRDLYEQSIINKTECNIRIKMIKKLSELHCKSQESLTLLLERKLGKL